MVTTVQLCSPQSREHDTRLSWLSDEVCQEQNGMFLKETSTMGKVILACVLTRPLFHPSYHISAGLLLRATEGERATKLMREFYTVWRLDFKCR